ncbi:MAG: hypothetical protein ABEI52_13005, partial [Halobacteriaceae archaeon]
DNVRLNSEFVQLVQADEELKSDNAMVQPRLDAIAESMSQQILRSLDQSPSVSDPSQLDVNFQALSEAGN